MFLTTEKLLKDHRFIKGVADSITRVNHSYILQLLDSIELNPEGDEKKNQFIDAMYNYLLSKIEKDNLFPKIIDSVLDKLTSSDEGKQKITEILDKTNDIVVEHKKKSKEPWVNIVGDVWDDNEGKFKVSLDWNDSFIAMLRKQGITGEDESQVVEMWLRGLANQ